jgi:hypothetical protein
MKILKTQRVLIESTPQTLEIQLNFDGHVTKLDVIWNKRKKPRTEKDLTLTGNYATKTNLRAKLLQTSYSCSFQRLRSRENGTRKEKKTTWFIAIRICEHAEKLQLDCFTPRALDFWNHKAIQHSHQIGEANLSTSLLTAPLENRLYHGPGKLFVHFEVQSQLISQSRFTSWGKYPQGRNIDFW